MSLRSPCLFAASQFWTCRNRDVFRVAKERSSLIPAVVLIFHGMSDVPANKLITARATSIIFDCEGALIFGISFVGGPQFSRTFGSVTSTCTEIFYSVCIAKNIVKLMHL